MCDLSTYIFSSLHAEGIVDDTLKLEEDDLVVVNFTLWFCEDSLFDELLSFSEGRYSESSLFSSSFSVITKT